MRRLLDGVPRRGLAWLAALLAALLAAPWLANDYLLTVLIIILYFAYTGQAWNIMFGFAGQLSLGHAIYVGLGGYTAAALYFHFGIGPWIGLVAAVAVGAACGAIIGFLAFRFGVGGVYFAILTIAFAEFARIGFDHFTWVGGSGGLFLPVANYSQSDIWNLRGKPIMFYYVILVLTVAAFVLCHALLRSRVGYYWQAIREDEAAARALGIDTFRYKMYAVLISAGMTSVAGVFFAFYYNNLFPEQVFSIARSIEIILGPIIGGAGTLVRPDRRRLPAHRPCRDHVGVLACDRPGRARHAPGVLRPGAAGDHHRSARGRMAVAGPAHRTGETAIMTALLSIDGVSKRFRGLLAVDNASFRVTQGSIFAVIGPNGAGKTTLFNIIAGVLTPDQGSIIFAGQRVDGLRPDEICRRGIGRTFQLVRPFPALSVEDNVIVGAMLHRPDLDRSARACARGAAPARPVRQARPTGRGPDPAGSQAAGSRARACDRPEAASA